MKLNGIQYLYIVPVGNYNANSLIKTLNRLINDSNFSSAILKINGLVAFSYNTTFTIHTNNDSSIASLLGFDKGTFPRKAKPIHSYIILY